MQRSAVNSLHWILGYVSLIGLQYAGTLAQVEHVLESIKESVIIEELRDIVLVFYK